MTKKEQYIASLREIEIRLEKGGNLHSDLGNITAVLKKRLQYFWVGFYFIENNNLILGPFQGTPACVFLNMEEGVCSDCVRIKKVIIVPEIQSYPGHVACDPNSKSEIVVPFFNNTGEMKAVLDIDHDDLNAFDEIDQMYLEQLELRLRPIWK